MLQLSARSLVVLASLYAMQAGAQWTPVFSTSGAVLDLHAHDGKLHVASWFEGPAGEPAYVSGVYDGAALTFPPNDFTSGSVRVFTTHNGQLIAGGSFQRDGGPVGVGVWDGTTWTGAQYNVDVEHPVEALCSHDGQLYVGRTGSSDDPPPILVHDGTSYSEVGTDLFGVVSDITVYDDTLYAGGNFGLERGALARWNGTTWESAGPALLGGGVDELEPYDGRLYAGGYFTNTAGGTFPSNLLFHLATWNGSDLSGSHGGMILSGVSALCATPAGLYVGTTLSGPNGVVMRGIALWDGTAWQFMGNLAPDDAVTAIEAYDDAIYIGVSNGSLPEGQQHQVYRGSGQVGIPDLDEAQLRIAPVPATDRIEVLSPVQGATAFRIHDLHGHVVQQGQLDGAIGIAGLSSGVYVLELSSGGEVRRTRFIKD